MLLPDSKRTRYFLVQLIKFYKFKCERQSEVDNVMSELVKIINKSKIFLIAILGRASS